MRNVTITYAPLMTNETWLSGICAVCVFFTSFHFHFSQRFRCGAPTGLCLAEYTNKYTKKKKKRKHVFEVHFFIQESAG